MKWSLSSLGVFEKCPLRYRLQYIDKLPVARSTAASRGVDNHKLFEDRVKGVLPTLPLEYNYYESLAKEVIDKKGQAEYKVSLNKDWQPCDWDAEDVWYRGILDVYVPGDAAWIIDWKTGKIYPDHDDQKHLYATAILSAHGDVRHVRTEHVYIDIGKRREARFSRDELPGMQKHWEARAKFLGLTDPADMVPNPGMHCRWCPFSAKAGGPCRF